MKKPVSVEDNIAVLAGDSRIGVMAMNELARLEIGLEKRLSRESANRPVPDVFRST
jgi:hypothetical protein